jgi:hypothetical protein
MKKVTDPTTNTTVPWSDLLGLRMGLMSFFEGKPETRTGSISVNKSGKKQR